MSVLAPGKRSFVDLTEELQGAITAAGIIDGFALVFCAHTTCALVINEWETGVLSDLAARVSAMVPDEGYYAHDDLEVRTENLVEEERTNGPAHVAQMIMGGTSHAIPIEHGRPVFGRWQRLFLFELDDPKPRDIRFHLYEA